MKDEEKKTILYNDEEISEWRYYEIKMNECLENGDKEQALQYREKFINLYRQEKKEDSKKSKSEPITEVDSANNETLIGDYNKFKEQYDNMLPTMEKWLLENDYIVPASAYEMLNLFMEKFFNSDNDEFVEAQLRRENFEEFHEYVKSKLETNKRKRDIQTAINIAIDRIEEKEKGEKVLIKYSEIKLNQPNRSNRDILNNDVSKIAEIDQTTFYNWIKYLNNALKKLGYDNL